MSYAWNWTGRCRATDRTETFYTTGPYPDRASLRDHIEHHYQGLVFVDAAQADGPPKAVLRPVNPRYFQHGILDLVRLELGGVRKVARAFSAPNRLTTAGTASSRLAAGSSRLR